jgi:chromosome segregation ATPase
LRKVTLISQAEDLRKQLETANEAGQSSVSDIAVVGAESVAEGSGQRDLLSSVDAVKTQLDTTNSDILASEASLQTVQADLDAAISKKSALQISSMGADLESVFTSAQALETEVGALHKEIEIETTRRLALVAAMDLARSSLENERQAVQSIEAEHSAMSLPNEPAPADSAARSAPSTPIPISMEVSTPPPRDPAGSKLGGLEEQLAMLPADQYELVAAQVTEVKKGVEQLKDLLLDAAEQIAQRDMRIEDLEADLKAAREAPAAGTSGPNEVLEKLAQTLESSELFKGLR